MDGQFFSHSSCESSGTSQLDRPSFAHAATMLILGFEIASQRSGFLIASGLLVVIGVALIVLVPGKQLIPPV
jgi:hypothetical protein